MPGYTSAKIMQEFEMARKKRIDWSATIHEYQASDCTVEEFCTRIGIHPNTFYKNRKKVQGSETPLVKLPLKSGPMPQQSLLIQAGDLILKIPEGVDSATLETTLRVMKDLT
jgi:hypothetical protein